MNSPATLPPVVRDKLTGLASRIRFAHFLRGSSIGVLLVLSFLAALFLADLAFGLSQTALKMCSLGLLFLVGACAALIAFSRKPNANALAVLVEDRYPQLEERLLSSVELCNAQPGNESSELVNALFLETAAKTEPIDLTRVVSFEHEKRLARLAGAGLLLAGLLGLFVPQVGSFGWRFFSAWFAAPPAMEIVIEPGNKLVAKGRPVTITALICPGDGVPFPATCTLVLPKENGQSVRLPMKRDELGPFQYEITSVQEDIDYFVEVGGETTSTYRLTAVEPVEVVDLIATVSPPEYAHPMVHPVRTIKDSGNIDVFEFGRVRLEVRFNRPAGQGRLIVRDHQLSLQLKDENRSAFIDLPVLKPGEYDLSLHVESPEKFPATHALPRLRIIKDGPPVFSALQMPRTALVGNAAEAANAREVAPDDLLIFNFTAEDQVGLHQVAIDLRINDGAVRSETLVQGDGQTKVSSDFTFALKGRVKDGDLLLYRLRAVDNRRVAKGSFVDSNGQPTPGSDLEPQEAFAPAAEKWYALRIKTGAKPIEEQDILADRDDAKNRLEELKKRLLAERAELNKFRPRSRSQPELSPALKKELEGLHRQNDSARDESLLLAQSLAREMSLRFLAAKLFELAEDELAKSASSLDKAGETGADAGARDKQLVQADQQLLRGLKRLDALLKLNQELAQYRLDRAKLAELGRRQEELGRQASEADAKKLAAEQQRLAQEFKRLLEQSKLFQKSLDALREMEAMRLAKDAHQLARRQRELANQSADNVRRELMAKLAPLAKKQQELAMRAGKLGEETTRTMQANGMSRFQNTEAMKAADSLQQARVGDALMQQKSTSDELNRLAKDLENAIDLSRSPREAAKQLARRQEEIRRNLEQIGRDVARLPPDQLIKKLQDLTQAQQALQQAIKKLPVPAKPEEVSALRQAAENLAGQAAEKIEPEAHIAHAQMREVSKTLDQLAAKLPSQPAASKDSPADAAQRKQAAAARGLAKEQQELRAAVEKAVKDALGSPSVAQDQEKQKQLMAEAKQLADELMTLSQGAGDEAKQKAHEAAQSAQQAQESMKQSQAESKQGNAEQGSQAGQQAAQELDQAGVDAALASQMFAQKKTDAGAAQTAAELQQSRQAMQQAQQDLKQGQTSSAGKAMQQAGQAMRRAAQQAASQASPQGINSYIDQKMGKEGELIAGPNGLRTPDSKEPGRSWGELPGELRTRILQDLRARYGEDYGAIIQHYFQQIADVPMRKQ